MITAFDPDPGLRWLFCMTHPDDEISICAWIRRLTAAGVEVWISWTHDTPARRAEAQKGCELLGIPSERQIFFGATDGAVIDEIPALLPRFQEMMDRVKPDRVACGAFEQGHLDHDATNYLVNETFQGPVFEIPFYYSYLTRLPRINRFADPEGQEVIHMVATELGFKTLYAKSFPSQRIWINLVFANLRSFWLGDGMLVATERMRLQTWTDFRTPHHKPSLAKRIQASESWTRWLAALQAAKDFAPRPE